MSKVCECGGIMNYDSYFRANICNTCGKMERVAKNPEIAKGGYRCFSSIPVIANKNNAGITCHSSKPSLPLMEKSSILGYCGGSCYNVINKN